MVASLAASGCVFGADAVPPDSVAPYVEGARASLTMHQEGLIPSRFWFRLARCRADGGMVVVFEEVGLGGSEGLAMAMGARGVVPRGQPDAWGGGGFGLIDPRTDPEIAHFFAEIPEVPCP